MRRLSFLTVMAVIVVALGAIVFAGCSSSSGKASKVAGLPSRSTTVGGVEIKVTPTRVDSTGATFTVALDTHSGSLDVDVARGATLDVGGKAWTNPTWSGDRAGGHHRSGTLAFTATGAPSSTATLTLAGFANPVVMRWPS